ncbi:hypothetical protein B9479_004953 [Cryptococcus floricola]|uniref:F-box domain-containing protein n=1 Tax=Cryptococcus floricola TaxID=2591691 RepID=A0A5D3ASH2_9TREE|nr:hypothetical protein B9479_004953 [Cryptococcus floricola]
MAYNDLPQTGGRGPSSGVSWTTDGPSLRMEDAVVETVVTHTTRTTTSFQPISLPRVSSPTNLRLPDHLSSETYPLADQPAPADLRIFTMTLGGRRVVVQDDSAGAVESEISGPGWTRKLGSSRAIPVQSSTEEVVDEEVGFLQALNQTKGKDRKRNFSAESVRDAPTPPITGDEAARHSPPRKKARGLEEINIPHHQSGRALLSPLPSPDHAAATLDSSTPSSISPPNLGSGSELAALFSLPSLASHFDQLPDRLQQHFLMHLLRRSRMPTIQRISSFISNVLRRDFITQLPYEVAIHILRHVDGKSLANASRVCKRWKRVIDNERGVWKQRLLDEKLWSGFGTEESEEMLIRERYEAMDLHEQFVERSQSDEDDRLSPQASRRSLSDRPTPLKHVYRRRYQEQRDWIHTRPEHNSFIGHGTNVVTCLQFDDDKIVSASDDSSINVYNTSDGQLRRRLDGHEGGVWTLQYKGNTLVSGSTDRTVRIWDLDELRMTYVFTGHTSTVRCLRIVDPVWEEETQSYQPPFPMIVTGSRDATLRVWKLPQKDDPLYEGSLNPETAEQTSPEQNPFHVHLLEGHSLAVRAIATHGRICVSGSYDMSVRVWDIVTGTSLHLLNGHESKVYSIVYDPYRKRCASGSMDNTVKVWDVVSGECLHTLQGHTSLVGLLGLSPNYLVSAAADSSLRIWDPSSCEMENVLTSTGGAITCFQHDEVKVVSGSDGTLKLWDIKTGTFVRDLVVGISSVWQVAFNGNLLVAASNRNSQTVFDVFRFGQPSDHPVDDSSLDNLQPPRWERWAIEERKAAEKAEWATKLVPSKGHGKGSSKGRDIMQPGGSSSMDWDLPAKSPTRQKGRMWSGFSTNDETTPIPREQSHPSASIAPFDDAPEHDPGHWLNPSTSFNPSARDASPTPVAGSSRGRSRGISSRSAAQVAETSLTQGEGRRSSIATGTSQGRGGGSSTSWLPEYVASSRSQYTQAALDESLGSDSGGNEEEFYGIEDDGAIDADDQVMEDVGEEEE